MDFEGAPSSVPRRDLFHCANIWNFIWFPLNHIHLFLTLNPLTSRATLKLERGRAHHSRGPNSSYVSAIQFAPGRSPIVQTTARILAEILTVSLINKGLAGGDRHDPGEWDVDAAERPDGPR
jgi:hypothetical protein